MPKRTAPTGADAKERHHQKPASRERDEMAWQA
jgi:hypothetical protein